MKTQDFGHRGAALLGLAGCADAPVYAPQTSPRSTGYADKQLAENRYRVSFRGNSATGRETVEDYPLRRAAEVTSESRLSGVRLRSSRYQDEDPLLHRLRRMAGLARLTAGTGTAGTTGRPRRYPIPTTRPMRKSCLLKDDQAAKRTARAQGAGRSGSSGSAAVAETVGLPQTPSAPDRRRARARRRRNPSCRHICGTSIGAIGSSVTISISAPADARSSARLANSAGSGHFSPRRSKFSASWPCLDA